jgi:hypothetical protein
MLREGEAPTQSVTKSDTRMIKLEPSLGVVRNEVAVALSFIVIALIDTRGRRRGRSRTARVRGVHGPACLGPFAPKRPRREM